MNFCIPIKLFEVIRVHEIIKSKFRIHNFLPNIFNQKKNHLN